MFIVFYFSEVRLPASSSASPNPLTASTPVSGVSGSPVAVLGTAVAVSSTAVAVSGIPVEVSGTPVTVSGTPVQISSTPVAVSGTPVAVSGTPVEVSGTSIAVFGTPDAKSPMSNNVMVTSPTSSPHVITSCVCSSGIVNPLVIAGLI